MSKTKFQKLIASQARRITQAGVARALGVSDRTVRGWLAGDGKPSVRLQARAAEVFARDAVEAKPSAPVERAPAPSVSILEGQLSARERQCIIIRRIEAELEKIDDDDTVPKNHKAQLFGQLTTANAALAKLDGDGEQPVFTPAQIVRSPAWREIMGVFETVLSKHIHVAREFREALSKVVPS